MGGSSTAGGTTAGAAAGIGRLTARWAGRLDGSTNTVFSAAGVWPLLALLADAADGPARRELEDAVGLPQDRAAEAARALLARFGSTEGLSAALGLWTKQSFPLDEAWTARLPEGTHALLSGDGPTDRARLDAWATRQTGGLIERMPIKVDPATLLVLASALALTTDWEEPFDEGPPTRTDTGPWAGDDLTTLSRFTTGLGSVAVAEAPEGPLTLAEVRGNNGIDVHLLLGGPDMGPAEVMAAGMGVLAGRYPRTTADELPFGDSVGPGLAKREVDAVAPTPPSVWLRTVPFHITAEHDLLRSADAFGLVSAQDGSRGHFPGIGPHPLAVRSAAQSAMAEFGPVGFKAAAVTAFGFRAGSAMLDPVRMTVVQATFDRPFAFVAVHRETRLPLVAGWVAQPSRRSAVEAS